ncbi:unnamed protein product [Mycena citricolor]|uniref:Cyclin-like domain-containing protein n=1 Tax=Mycena citricolor TaxID=2018698 RepID=A0AAD2HFQ0_9AGAR|nr:unnamed protein product [Mycena citricolor]
MATDFWSSSHYNRWIVDRTTLRNARADDVQYVDDPEYLDFLAIYFAELLAKLGKKLNFVQRTVATATMFFRRFYLKNSYCETDPFMVAAACCYVAAKAEECPVHIKTVVHDARHIFAQDPYGVKNFPSDNSKLAEMEFYLVDDLECDLVIYHPYRALLALCKPMNSTDPDKDDFGVNLDDGTRYWGTGEGQLDLPSNGLQTAWFIINDTYRSELCLLYPPHLIAIAAIYLTCVFHPPTQDSVAASIAAGATAPEAPPRRSSRQSGGAERKKPAPDPVTFLAGLNVSLPLVASIAQEILGMYSLWERYLEGGAASSVATTPASPGEDDPVTTMVTPMTITLVLAKMREARFVDLRETQLSDVVPRNRVVERTQAAG